MTSDENDVAASRFAEGRSCFWESLSGRLRGHEGMERGRGLLKDDRELNAGRGAEGHGRQVGGEGLEKKDAEEGDFGEFSGVFENYFQGKSGQKRMGKGGRAGPERGKSGTGIWVNG